MIMDKKHSDLPITQTIAESQPEEGQLVTLENLPLELAQVSHRKKRLALEHYYRYNGNVSKLCQVLKIPRRTFYDWMNNDQRFREIIEIQKLQTDDEIEQALLEKATKQNDLGAMIFYLKSRHPNYKPVTQKLAYENKKEGVRFVLSRGE